ncbi:lactococcin 972 family bacteriocin [Corynebacterium rouxii]|uniref:lactococcin 972 family bacteriocin n=1 Tax=Corynebacterium rouxii TaxID=2719119 RepID=UPI0036F1B42C
MVTFDTTSAPPSGKITTYKIRGLPGSTTEQVGGGTWTYGWNLINASTRQCFSRYIHRSKSHTATAIMGGVTRSSTARSGSWASAEVVGELTLGTCNAYWSTQ